jgi:hypothetical protein
MVTVVPGDGPGDSANTCARSAADYRSLTATRQGADGRSAATANQCTLAWPNSATVPHVLAVVLHMTNVPVVVGRAVVPLRRNRH